MIECVGVAIMVGLAVDYVVHVAVCIAVHRRPWAEAVPHALRTVAAPCVSGAVTTVGAALFLLPCEMAVFQQFGVMVIVTLSTALLFALVVFPAACMALDVRDPATASLAALWRGDWRAFLGRADLSTSVTEWEAIGLASGQPAPRRGVHDADPRPDHDLRGVDSDAERAGLLSSP